MRMKIVAAASLVGLMATGCADGGTDSTDAEPSPAGTLLPQKLTKPKSDPDLEPTPSPAADASFAEQLEYELRLRTLKMAQAEGKTTVECPDLASTKGQQATCKATYDGLKLDWYVSIGDNAAWSDDYVQYEATPSSGILTRDGVARLLFGNYQSLDYALCNDIPEAVLSPLDTQSEYKCETVSQGKKPFGYAGTSLRATDAGPRAY
ncbi:hypothetical protein ACWD3I_19165 [Streptomyces sp. NPDC002817]|uniref:hypothetical protein n=1 Tax=Streptomyces sp. NPDC088357 TaxID=3154655 RepID=UPI00341884B3